MRSDFQQLSTLLNLIESLASAGRCQRLRFHDAGGQPVGSLILDSGSIGFGVELAGQPYIDPLFAAEVPLHAASLIKTLQGEPLTEAEALRLVQLPLRTRRAVRALTARAMLQLAWVCDLTARSVRSEPLPSMSRGPVRVVFSPSELLLAAGTAGDIRLEDPAVIEFETPPLLPKERWLFVCQREDAGRPWPVMGRQLSALRVSHILAKGTFCEGLVRHPALQATESLGAPPQAVLFTFDSQLHYVVKTASYVALMIYPLDHQRRLLVALDAMTQRGRRPVVQIPESAILASLQSEGPPPSVSARSVPDSPRVERLRVEPPSAESPGQESPSAESPVSRSPSQESPNAQSPDPLLHPRESVLTPLLPPVGAYPSAPRDSVATHWNEPRWTAGEFPTRPSFVPAAPAGGLGATSPEAGDPSEAAAPIRRSLDPRREDEQASPAPEPSAVNHEAQINTPIYAMHKIGNESVRELLGKLADTIDGFIGAAICDSDRDICLGALGGDGDLNPELAAINNGEVFRAQRKAVAGLDLYDEIEDILITLGRHYHLMRPLGTHPHLFIYLALDRSAANLALARRSLSEHERDAGL